ncbi:DUF4292 domain-containing protein [Polaribacter sp. MED152]|uniref:DUF4292 domain-containing protein n=1 Tax=Polaribacter sp. MED152 TaxID=313598 RepID=UPI000186F47C|nr:DUF4292 domain-containing protein [Polaribacter sp. MED152]EAQ43185.2 hypothetical protein MED152_10685 [Polaribacter sp. MED152]
MKFFKYLVLFTIVFTSCKSNKNMIDATAVAKNFSAKKVARKHMAANFDKQTIDAKLKVNFDNGKTNQNLTVSMKMKKDEVIWLRGTKFITVFKAEITPTKVRYYSSVFKHSFEGDFSMLKELLGVEINFEQLQNLFLGQALQDVTAEKQDVNVLNNRYVLNPEQQALLYNIFYTINPAHFKLDNQSIVNDEKGLRLDIKYPNYNLINSVVFPTAIEIKAKDKKRITVINLEYKTVEFDTDVNMSFNMPAGYKQLTF